MPPAKINRSNRVNNVWRYTLYGAAFGFCFPVFATALEIFVVYPGVELSWHLIERAQRGQPLLWIIDSAPLFLGLFASFAGRRQDAIEAANADLYHEVQDTRFSLAEREERLEFFHRILAAIFRGEALNVIIAGVVRTFEEKLRGAGVIFGCVHENGELRLYCEADATMSELPSVTLPAGALPLDHSRLATRPPAPATDSLALLLGEASQRSGGEWLTGGFPISAEMTGMFCFHRQSGESWSDDEMRFLRETLDFLRVAARNTAYQQEILHSRDAARAANQAKSEFLANMSHEIRTPLNAILGMSALLEESGLNETQSEYVSIFRRAGDHLLELIDEVLDLSRIEAGALRVASEPFDVQETLQVLVELYSAQARAKGLEFQYDCAAAVPPVVCGDAGRLRQILSNLLGNAVKFTRSGSVQLKVECAESTGTATQTVSLCFRVIDTGIGIAHDKIETIFDSFAQADSSTTREFGGTGLGLTISRRLVALMGGTLNVSSTPGVGSIFSVQLDFAPAADLQNQHEALAEPASPAPAAGTHRNLRLLIAEDDADNRYLIEKYLAALPEDLGAAVGLVETVENGALAVRRVREASAAGQAFDLLFLDMQMPVMDGYTAAREIRSLGAGGDLRIVALTAHALPGDEARCLEAGCDAYLTKPLRKAGLMQELREFLARPASG